MPPFDTSRDLIDLAIQGGEKQWFTIELTVSNWRSNLATSTGGNIAKEAVCMQLERETKQKKVTSARFLRRRLTDWVNMSGCRFEMVWR